VTKRERQLDADNARLRATVDELRALVTDLRRQLDRQQVTIDRLTRTAFGRASERLPGPTVGEPATASDSPVSADGPPAPPPEGATAGTPRRGRHGRRRTPAELPVERVVIDLADAEKPCPCCGAERVRVGLGEPSRRYDYRPAAVFVRETVRVSYACRRCERGGSDPQFVRPPLPPEPLPRSSAAPGLLAQVIVAKFADHLPLNRQEGILARHGLPVSRSTTCDWLRGCAAVLDPLYRRMLTRVKTSHAIHVDDTPVSLLAPRRTAYAWVAVGDAANPYTVFALTPGRGQEHPERWLAGFTGFVHADAYAGYNGVHGGDRHVGCWMHARRGFHDVREQDPRAVDALAFIRTLYAAERTAKERGLTDTALSQYRREHAAPILDRFADWLREQRRVALPKSGFGQAVSYALNQWPTLVRYVDDGRLHIDNGPAERALRPLALGRNNWLFIGGDGGLHSAAVLLSVVATAKRHGLNPWAYLRDVLTRLPARPPDADLSDLLPDRWHPSDTSSPAIRIAG
jgi:transposase